MSSAVTNVSKKRQVRRATSRSARVSSGRIARWPATGGGKLAHRAANGDSAHKAANGAAIGQVCCPETYTASPIHAAKERPAAICAAIPRGSNCEVVARLRGRYPFQQMSPADRYAVECAADRIGHHPCLMGEKSDQEGALQKPQFEITAQRAKVIAQGDARAPGHHSGNGRDERRQRNRHHDEARPYRGDRNG